VGTKLRHLNASTLKELENKIEALKESVDIINVTESRNGHWFAHFEISQHTTMENKIVGEVKPSPTPKRKKTKRRS